LIFADKLFLLSCVGSDNAWVSGAIWSVFNFRITSSFACFRIGRFLKLNEPKSSLPEPDVDSLFAMGTDMEGGGIDELMTGLPRDDRVVAREIGSSS